MKVTFNFNDTVHVELTEIGAKRINERRERFNSGGQKFKLPLVTEGPHEAQLWELIGELGGDLDSALKGGNIVVEGKITR